MVLCTEIAYGAMQCAVLRERMALPGERGEGGQAVLLRACYAMSGTRLGYAATRLLRDVRYSHRPCCFAPATRCPVLGYAMLQRACYAMSGADVGHAGTRLREEGGREGEESKVSFGMSGTGLGYAATPPLCDVRY
eukprot:2148143-Rhodomonas_salina.1